MVLPALDQWLVRRMGRTREGVPSPDQLRAWQLEKLRGIVVHATANSPFYAEHLSGIDPAAITTLEAFSRLPVITPDDLRETPQRFLCVSQDEIERVVTLASSGTTGEPKRVFYTAEDLEATMDYFHRGMSNLIGDGETAFVLFPGDRPGGVGRLLYFSLARTGAHAVAHGTLEDTEVALDQCLALGAQCVVGSAAHVHLLARAWEKRGLPAGRIKSVLLCWDAVPDAVVRTVERIFGCRVFRHWGMIETGLGGAVECAPGSGMHLRETDVYVEVVSPKTGDLLPNGEFGELVVTTPRKMGMPLIRYRTGDMGRILTGPCRCNSPMRRLDPRVYRVSDGVELGSGVLTLRELNEVLYAVDGLADFSATLDVSTLRVVVTGESEGVPEKVHAALATLPVVGQALAEKTVEIDVVYKRGLNPAVPGLGKRRIQENGL